MHSWLRLARRLPFRFVCCCPPGYEPDAATLALARSGDAKGLVEVSHDPAEAVRGADAIYTDVWASMGMKEEADKRKRDFAGFSVRPSYPLTLLPSYPPSQAPPGTGPYRLFCCSVAMP